MKYRIHFPSSGGKAGKGLNKTSALQVRREGQIVAQFRYTVGDPDSRKRAVQKAAQWIDAQTGDLRR